MSFAHKTRLVNIQQNTHVMNGCGWDEYEDDDANDDDEVDAFYKQMINSLLGRSKCGCSRVESIVDGIIRY